MRITMDLTPAVQSHAGVGRYAQELACALVALGSGEEFSFFYTDPKGRRPEPPLDTLPRKTLRWSNKRWRLSVLLATLVGVGMDRRFPACDVFHATDYVLPPLNRPASVLTIYDLTVWLFPEYHLPLNRWFLRLLLPRFARRADAVIAISENTRRDVVRLFHISPEKVGVTCLGVDSVYRPIRDEEELARVREKYKLPNRYILYFGTIEPRKNLVSLLQAYRSLLTQSKELPDLVIGGRKGWLHEPISRSIRELGLEARVHFTDWVEDKDIPALMSGATVFVYPSFYEGFGLPPLEAMACGTPVICSNTSSLPEVVGDGGMLVEPHDLSALANAMDRVLADQDLRAGLTARGLAQARRFSWERAARETLAIYEKAGAQHAYRH